MIFENFLRILNNPASMEEVDLSTKEGYEKICKLIEKVENDPSCTFWLNLFGIDMDNLKKAVENLHNKSVEAKKEEYEAHVEAKCECNENCDCEEDCDCDCEDECDCCCDCDEDEEESYWENIDYDTYRYFKELAKDFLDGFEVDLDEDISLAEKLFYRNMLVNFAAYIMSR